MEPTELLELFDHLAAQVAVALENLDNWGLSGLRATQYNHDVVADEIFRTGIAASGMAVLTEESGLTGSGAVTVVVDPIDGSTNAYHGLPWYAASVCAVDSSGPLASLVLNMATGERYRAIRGRGAYRDRSPIFVGSGNTDVGEEYGAGVRIRPSATNDLSRAFVAFSGLPPSHGGWSQYRCLGAAALDICCVADGRIDGYVDVNQAHGVWDYLGSMLVCSEAGGEMVEGTGRELVVIEPGARRGPVAGATKELTEQLVGMLEAWA